MPPEDAPEPEHGIVVQLDQLLKERGKTLTWLEEVSGLSYANLSKMKNGRARAFWFTSLGRLCEVLNCQPGDILSYRTPRTPTPHPQDATSEASASTEKGKIGHG
ncbi:helix-turn-helix domain-containing protein [Streptomyces decoyicus]|uniref:helix-turn-helix domain-containing protein n=1 Tax=Streptomyces decoyicus TaxID=249567 RepID=UPI0036576B04